MALAFSAGSAPGLAQWDSRVGRAVCSELVIVVRPVRCAGVVCFYLVVGNFVRIRDYVAIEKCGTLLGVPI